jgi:dTMP kinase
MDLDLSKDVYESYRIFQTKIISQYDAMSKKENFTIIDASLGIKEQQSIMREKVKRLLPQKLSQAIKENS